MSRILHIRNEESDQFRRNIIKYRIDQMHFGQYLSFRIAHHILWSDKFVESVLEEKTVNQIIVCALFQSRITCSVFWKKTAWWKRFSLKHNVPLKRDAFFYLIISAKILR
jgi:hypothetical protein